MTLHIQTAALLMTIQDGGRNGYQRFGMPESGPMDWWAFRAANQLVGNPPDAASVEFGFSSAEFHLEARCLLAVSGIGYRLIINGREMPLWMAILGKTGDHIRMEKVPGGNWAYLAAAGGIQSEIWMGSRSTYLAAGLGQKLTEGNRLALSPAGSKAVVLAGRSLPLDARPPYVQTPVIRVIPGPHQDRFRSDTWHVFCETKYSVSSQSDRMGYRLVGPSLRHTAGADLVSQGMVLGEVQVPGDGQPIVMMPDHPTTGGYACIATVAQVDLPLLAQVEPGRGVHKFQPVELAEAQAAWVEVIKTLDAAVSVEEDTWFGL